METVTYFAGGAGDNPENRRRIPVLLFQITENAYFAEILLCSILFLSAVLNLWNIGSSGFSNTYYAAAVLVSCLLIIISILWLAVDFLALSYLTGKITATLIASFWNYHGQKRYTFRSQEMR